MDPARQNPQIDPERLTSKPLVLEGMVAPGDLERLGDALASGEGELRYRVTARLDPQRRRVLSCIIEGSVFLTCQSTLDTFRHPVSIEERLVLVEDESQLPPIQEESDAEDYLVADEPLDVLDLVEDAVILALPMMPRKPGLEWEDAEKAPREEAAESPFAKLASLKRTQ
jgi:uncharacterized protein